VDSNRTVAKSAGAAQRVLDSPENKEKFRLPPYIRDMRIERGRLIISSR